MGLKKCPECGKLINDELSSCSNCGYPFDGTEEKVTSKYCMECGAPLDEKTGKCTQCGYPIESDETKNDSEDNNENGLAVDEVINEDLIRNKKSNFKNPKTIGIVCGAKYRSAKKNYDNQEYKVAAEQYKELKNYKDAEKMYKKSVHMEAVKNDKTAPTISYPSVQLEEGDTFDSGAFVKNRVTATDEVSGNLHCSMVSSDVDPNTAGCYTIEVSATDEAGNVQREDIDIVVRKKCNLENLKKSVSSIYSTGEIPNLYDMEYDEDKKILHVFVLGDGMAEATVYAKIDSSLKASWNDMADTIKKASMAMYTQVLADGFTEVEGVSIAMLNDKNTDKVLLSFYNGVKVYDVTD